MGHGIVHIDLPEAREPLPDFLVRQNTDAERRLTFDILVECDLGTGQQADRNVRLSDRRESASNRVVEFRRHQLVPDLGAPVRDVVQTVVTHRRHSSSCEKPGFLPGPPPLAGVKISAFPTPPKDRKLTYRHATFQSAWTSPLARELFTRFDTSRPPGLSAPR